MVAIYEAVGASLSGNIAIKLSMGKSAGNYLRTDLIGDLVQLFDNLMIVECSTAYGGMMKTLHRHCFSEGKGHIHSGKKMIFPVKSSCHSAVTEAAS